MEKFNKALEKLANIPAQIKFFSKPFVKWVGGKRALLKQLKNYIPKSYQDYYEPFLGGGALFFDLQPMRAFLSDTNLDLIITYQVVRDNLEVLIEQLQKYKKNHNKEFYYKIRTQRQELSSLLVASRFIYLNKTCYNGLYRVNAKGEFNVPMGSYKNPLICDEETLKSANLVLQNKIIECTEYSKIKPSRNDFVYLDPPYDDCFSSYSKKGFNFDKQKELSVFCKELNKRGVRFLLSNSDTEDMRNLYKNFEITEVSNIRMVSCKGKDRGKIKELIIKNY